MFGANVVLCCAVLYKVFNCFIIYSTVYYYVLILCFVEI